MPPCPPRTPSCRVNHDRAIRQSAAPRQRAAPQARARTACRTGLGMSRLAGPFSRPRLAGPTLADGKVELVDSHGLTGHVSRNSAALQPAEERRRGLVAELI